MPSTEHTATSSDTLSTQTAGGSSTAATGGIVTGHAK